MLRIIKNLLCDLIIVYYFWITHYVWVAVRNVKTVVANKQVTAYIHFIQCEWIVFTFTAHDGFESVNRQIVAFPFKPVATFNYWISYQCSGIAIKSFVSSFMPFKERAKLISNVRQTTNDMIMGSRLYAPYEDSIFQTMHLNGAQNDCRTLSFR